MSAGAPAGGMQSAYRRTDIRAYKLGDRHAARDDRGRRPRPCTRDSRLFVQRLRRDGKLIEFKPDNRPAAGGRRRGRRQDGSCWSRCSGRYGNEVSDPELLDVPAEAVDVVLTNKAYDGKTLLELTKTDFARGVYLNKITRGATSTEHSDPGADQGLSRRHPATRGPRLRTSRRPSRIWDTQTGRRTRPTWSSSVWASSSAA